MCIWIKNDLFRLNNVYTDLIKIEAHQRQWLGVLEQWVTVTLQGEGVVSETTIEPPQNDGSELVRQMRMQVPSCSARITIPTHDTNYTWPLKIRME